MLKGFLYLLIWSCAICDLYYGWFNIDLTQIRIVWIWHLTWRTILIMLTNVGRSLAFCAFGLPFCCQVEFVLLLWLQLIPLLMSELVFPDFRSGLWTNHILWTFQAFSTRPGLLRHPALRMELLLACYPPQWEVRGGHYWQYSRSCRGAPHILEMPRL